MRSQALRNAVGLGLGAGMVLTCVVLLAVPNDVELMYKQMTPQEAMEAAKALQRTRAVHSPYEAEEKAAAQARAAKTTNIRAKHAQHRTSSKAAIKGSPVVAPAAVHQVDAAPAVVQKVGSEAPEAQPSAVARPDVPRPADYARGLIVQPGHTEDQIYNSIAAPREDNRIAPSATRSRAPSSAPSQISSIAAQAQIYNNDANVKVVQGTEGDNVASGIGGGIGGQEWVRARQARIAHEQGGEDEDKKAQTSSKYRKSRSIAAHHPKPATRKLNAPAVHNTAGNFFNNMAAPMVDPRTLAPSAAARGSRGKYDGIYNNDAGVKVVEGTEGDGVASGIGGGIDGRKWVAARKARIADEVKENTYTRIAEHAAKKEEEEQERAGAPYADQPRVYEGARRITSQDVERTVGTNIVFHGLKNEGGIPEVAESDSRRAYSAKKQSLHYVSDKAGAGGVNAIFDDIAQSEHGANNKHLHKVAKRTPKD